MFQNSAYREGSELTPTIVAVYEGLHVFGTVGEIDGVRLIVELGQLHELTVSDPQYLVFVHDSIFEFAATRAAGWLIGQPRGGMEEDTPR